MILFSLLAATAMGHMTTSDLCGSWDNMLNAFGDCTVNLCDGEAFARTYYNFRVNLEGEDHPTLYDSVTTIHSERYCAPSASVDEDGVTTYTKNEEDSVVMRVKQHGGYVLQSEKLVQYGDLKDVEIEGQATMVFYPTGFVVTLAEGANPMYSWPDGTCATAVEYLNEFCPCGGTWGEGERTVDTLLECDGLDCPAFFKQKAHSHSTLHEYNERDMLVLTAPTTDFSSHNHQNELGWALERTSNAGCLRPSGKVFDGKELEKELEEHGVERQQMDQEESERAKCKDLDDRCEKWAKQGYCNSDSEWNLYVVLHCPASCEIRDRDSRENCEFWAATYGCDESSKYSEFMNLNCMATCHPDGPCEYDMYKPGGRYFKPPPPKPSNGGGNGGTSYTTPSTYTDNDYGSGDDDYRTEYSYTDEGGDYGSDPYAAGTEDEHAIPTSERNLFYITGAVVSATLVSSAFYYFCLRKKPELAADPSDYVSIVDEQT